MGWQMPSVERQQPGFTTLMSLALASAATMPIPVMPGGLAYSSATTATMPLPVVSADVALPRPHTDADARRSPVEEEHSGGRKGPVDGQDRAGNSPSPKPSRQSPGGVWYRRLYR